MASGYSLQYNQVDHTYYCLKDSETCKLKFVWLSLLVSERMKYLQLYDVCKPQIGEKSAVENIEAV